MVGELKGPLNAQIELGSRALSLTRNPMVDESGAHLGTVMEWVDRTEALHTEREVQEVITAVMDGDIDGAHRSGRKGGLLRDAVGEDQRIGGELRPGRGTRQIGGRQGKSLEACRKSRTAMRI